MRDYTKLRAFELADELVLMIYKITKLFPKDEVYGLSAQMRRAAMSVPSNIVEGCSRFSKKEYCHFLNISFGSLKELHYQFSVADRLGYIIEGNSQKIETLFLETEKVLAGLIRSVKT